MPVKNRQEEIRVCEGNISACVHGGETRKNKRKLKSTDVIKKVYVHVYVHV